jgi:hypothetical protein
MIRPTVLPRPTYVFAGRTAFPIGGVLPSYLYSNFCSYMRTPARMRTHAPAHCITSYIYKKGRTVGRLL